MGLCSGISLITFKESRRGRRTATGPPHSQYVPLAFWFQSGLALLVATVVLLGAAGESGVTTPSYREEPIAGLIAKSGAAAYVLENGEIVARYSPEQQSPSAA